MLQKTGRGGGGEGGSVKEGRGRQPRCLATSCYQGEGPGIIPGCGEGHRESHFAQRNRLFSLYDSLCRSCPEGLVAGSQPASHKQAVCWQAATG